MRVSVDEEMCCGSGNCAVTAPQVFDQNEDDGLVVLLQPDPPVSQAGPVRAAAAGCPTGAIQLDRE